MNPNPHILFISSANPLKGPGRIGLNMYQQLQNAGLDVDMMTIYPVEKYPDIIYVKKNAKRTIWERVKNKIKKVFGRTLPGDPYCFFYKKETNPPIPTPIILNKIKKKYDWVIIYFWQGLLSFQTVEAIYDKFGGPVVFFVPPDYSHMSGGCHFPGDCKGYQTGCGCCPAIHSKNKKDFTNWNVQYRKNFYEKVKPVVFGNSYMHTFYEKSYLLRGGRTIKSVPQINSVTFYPLDKRETRMKYGIPDSVNFVVSFGSQSLTDPRKGMEYLIEALNLWSQSLTESEKNKIMLVTIGKNFEKIQSRLPFQILNLGYIPIEQLSEFYSLADIFVCPSINDPGPSMVSQSIACGTPVVGFEMGALLDLVKDRDTGCCVRLKDVSELANGIDKYFRMTDEQRIKASGRCREFALECTPDKRLKQWIEQYEKYSVQRS